MACCLTGSEAFCKLRDCYFSQLNIASRQSQYGTPVLRLSLASAILITATAIIHVIGISIIIVILRRKMLPAEPPKIAWLLIRVAWMLMIFHLGEITLWALFYRGSGCFPGMEPALYFSAVTYTTIGYGDLVLPARWRVLGPVEGLTGILMCGLSASVFFAISERIYVMSLKSKLPPAAWES